MNEKYSTGICRGKKLKYVGKQFSTFNTQRPTKQNYTQFGDPFNTIIVLHNTGYGNPKVGRD